MTERNGELARTEREDITQVRVVYTVEYDVVDGAVAPPGNEDEAMFFVQSLLEAAPDRAVDIGWDDDEERTAQLEPCGWGVQTDYWGDLWTGIEPPAEMADSGLMYCTAHHGVIECDEGDGPCDNASDHRDAVRAYPCPVCRGTFVDPDDEDEECSACDEGVTRCTPTPLLYAATDRAATESGPDDSGRTDAASQVSEQ